MEENRRKQIKEKFDSAPVLTADTDELKTLDKSKGIMKSLIAWARNDHGQVSHIFAGKAEIDGDAYIIGFTIIEDSNGRRYYNHELTEINKVPGGSGQAENSPALTSTPAVREPISIIVRNHLFVKSDGGAR